MARRVHLTDAHLRNDAHMDSLLSEVVTSAKYFVFALLFVTLIGQFVIVHGRITQQSRSQELRASPVSFANDSDTRRGANSLQFGPEFLIPEGVFADYPDIADPPEDLSQFFVQRRPAMYQIAYSD